MKNILNKCLKESFLLKRFVIMSMMLVFIVSIAGCTPSEELSEIKSLLEKEDYLSGWVYVNDIMRLDEESNTTGRMLFSLYVNEDNSEEYAVLKIVKLTIPDTYSVVLTNVSYDKNSNTAKCIDKNDNIFSFSLTYDSEEILIKDESLGSKF